MASILSIGGVPIEFPTLVLEGLLVPSLLHISLGKCTTPQTITAPTHTQERASTGCEEPWLHVPALPTTTACVFLGKSLSFSGT